MAGPVEETKAGYRVGGVEANSIMGETDLERRVTKLDIMYSL
jgi:hypothetical protein